MIYVVKDETAPSRLMMMMRVRNDLSGRSLAFRVISERNGNIQFRVSLTTSHLCSRF